MDRRSARRIAVTEPVIVAWARGNVVGELRDLSERGMFIALANAGDVTGTRLVVHIGPAYPRRAVEVTGVVRWVDHRGMGVELAAVGAHEASALEMLMRV